MSEKKEVKGEKKKVESKLPDAYKPIREINVKRKNYRDFQESD